MALAWFICQYKRRLGQDVPTRYCAMDDFTAVIRADGGDWTETEVLGNYAVVKVRASETALIAIGGVPGFQRLPLARMADSLGSLSNAQRTATRDRILAMGYSDSEIKAALGSNLGQRTLGDVLRFAASRRLKPRYERGTDQIVLDGPVQPCRLVDDVDRQVT